MTSFRTTVRTTRATARLSARQRQARQQSLYGVVALFAVLVAFVALGSTAAAMDAHNGTLAAVAFATLILSGFVALVALSEGAR